LSDEGDSLFHSICEIRPSPPDTFRVDPWRQGTVVERPVPAPMKAGGRIIRGAYVLVQGRLMRSHEVSTGSGSDRVNR